MVGYSHAEDPLPVRIVLGGDDVDCLRIEHSAALVKEEEAAVVLVEMLLVDGLDEASDGVDPTDVLRQIGAGIGKRDKHAAAVAVFPGQDGGIVFVGNAGERVLVVEQRRNVRLEAGDHPGIGEEGFDAVGPMSLKYSPSAAHFAVSAVAGQGNDQAQAAVVSGLEGIVDVLESLGIEFASLGSMQRSQPMLSPKVCERMTRAPMALAVSMASSTSKWLG